MNRMKKTIAFIFLLVLCTSLFHNEFWKVSWQKTLKVPAENMSPETSLISSFFDKESGY